MEICRPCLRFAEQTNRLFVTDFGISLRKAEAMKTPTTLGMPAVMLGATAVSRAQPSARGAVELSNGAKVPQNPSLPKLNLTNTQREQIRETVLTEHHDVEFRLKTPKSAKDFTPAIRATLPKGVKAQSLPITVLSRMPELRDYIYVKMKDQVLIVNGLTNKIVDVF
jgi:hypothetical protein